MNTEKVHKAITSTLLVIAAALVLYRLVVFVKSVLVLDVEASKQEEPIDTDSGIFRGVLKACKVFEQDTQKKSKFAQN